MTNPYERTCYAPPASRSSDIGDRRPPAIESELRPCHSFLEISVQMTCFKCQVSALGVLKTASYCRDHQIPNYEHYIGFDI